MNNQEIIYQYYKEAVVGLNESTRQDMNLWYDYIIHLPINLQIVYTVIVFHNQVFNGGFHQYLFNSYGQFAYLTLKNLRVIKAFKAAEILNKAMEEVNAEQYTIDNFREKVFYKKIDKIVNFDDELNSSLDILDNEYYSSNEDLENLLTDYLQSH